MACEVLPGIFGLLVQGFLFLACVGILVVKKFKEGKERSWFDFGLDGSKQIIGAGWIHVLNLVFAKQLHKLTESGDECTWYWLNIMCDTTLGVAVEYLALQTITSLLKKRYPDSTNFDTGSYRDGHDFHIETYFKQLLVWLSVVSIMKVAMLAFMFICSTPLEAGASLILAPFFAVDSLKLIVVMIITPVCMNALQFWLTDNFLRKRDVDDIDDDLPSGPNMTGGGRELSEPIE